MAKSIKTKEVTNLVNRAKKFLQAQYKKRKAAIAVASGTAVGAGKEKLKTVWNITTENVNNLIDSGIERARIGLEAYKEAAEASVRDAAQRKLNNLESRARQAQQAVESIANNALGISEAEIESIKFRIREATANLPAEEREIAVSKAFQAIDSAHSNYRQKVFNDATDNGLSAVEEDLESARSRVEKDLITSMEAIGKGFQKAIEKVETEAVKRQGEESERIRRQIEGGNEISGGLNRPLDRRSSSQLRAILQNLDEGDARSKHSRARIQSILESRGD